MKLLFASLVLIFFSCKNKVSIPEDFDYGKIDNGVYVNDYFDFEIPVPGEWHVQNKEQIERIRQAGGEMIAEKNKELAEQVKASAVNSAILLAAYKYKLDSAVQGYNPSFSIIVENLGSMSGVSTGREYMSYVKKIMANSGIEYRSVSEFYSEPLGNKKFDVMENIMSVKGFDINQKYYAAIERNFAFVVIASFIRSDQKKELVNIIDKIKFN